MQTIMRVDSPSRVYVLDDGFLLCVDLVEPLTEEQMLRTCMASFANPVQCVIEIGTFRNLSSFSGRLISLATGGGSLVAMTNRPVT